MDRSTFDASYRSRLERLSTTNLSDALDAVGAHGAVSGIRPMFDCPKVVGRAVTIKITAAGKVRSKRHLGVEAIASAEAGDIIAIDNHGDTNNNCWGEVLSCAAKVKGVSGVVVDGAVRDLDVCKEMAKECKVTRFGTADQGEYTDYLQWETLQRTEHILRTGSADQVARIATTVFGRQIQAAGRRPSGALEEQREELMEVFRGIREGPPLAASAGRFVVGNTQVDRRANQRDDDEE